MLISWFTGQISVNELESVLFIWTLSVYAGFIALVIATCLAVETRRRRNHLIRGKTVNICPPIQMRVTLGKASDLTANSAHDRCLVVPQITAVDNGNTPYRWHMCSLWKLQGLWNLCFASKGMRSWPRICQSATIVCWPFTAQMKIRVTLNNLVLWNHHKQSN